MENKEIQLPDKVTDHELNVIFKEGHECRNGGKQITLDDLLRAKEILQA